MTKAAAGQDGSGKRRPRGGVAVNGESPGRAASPAAGGDPGAPPELAAPVTERSRRHHAAHRRGAKARAVRASRTCPASGRLGQAVGCCQRPRSSWTIRVRTATSRTMRRSRSDRTRAMSDRPARWTLSQQAGVAVAACGTGGAVQECFNQPGRPADRPAAGAVSEECFVLQVVDAPAAMTPTRSGLSPPRKRGA
jgi:hypothetical protein